MFAKTTTIEPSEKTLQPFFYFATSATLVVLVIFFCWLGIFPNLVVEQIREFLLIQ